MIKLRWEKEGSKLKADGLPNPHTLFRHCPIVLHCVAVWFEPKVAAMAGRSCYGSSSHCLRSVDCWVDGLVAAFPLANFVRDFEGMAEPLRPSGLAGIKHKNVNATRGEILNVSHCCLSLRASKSFLNSDEVVKMHDRNQVKYRRSGWCGNRTTANLVFSDAWNCLYEWHVFSE